jgi:peroxiredoxin
MTSLLRRIPKLSSSDLKPFVGLPDPTHTVLKLYGQEIKLFKFGRMPAQVTIDKQGLARFVHYGHDMTDIPENEEILELLETMNKE